MKIKKITSCYDVCNIPLLHARTLQVIVVVSIQYTKNVYCIT